MQSLQGRRAAALIAISLGAALVVGCGSKEPEPNAKGYYEGPMESKAASGKSPGSMSNGGGSPATPPR